MVNKLPRVLCPKCGKFGFLSGRWVSSTYYPKFCSVHDILLEEAEEKFANDPLSEVYKKRVDYLKKRIRGSKYRGRSRKHLSQYNEAEGDAIDKKSLKRVTYGKYFCFYIGHYDKGKYKQQMIKYRKREVKSRPNGRKWCKLGASFHEYRIINHPDGPYVKFRKSTPRSNRKIFE